MPNGKTIRQIADEIGVTRQAVYQKIKSNKSAVKRLQLYTFTVDSTKYYTSDGEKLIKSLFSDKQAVNKGVNVSTDSVYTPVNDFTPCKQEKMPINTAFSGDTVNEAVNKGVNEGVNKFTDLFTAQLTEKDKQLAEKDKQIAEKDKHSRERQTACRERYSDCKIDSPAAERTGTTGSISKNISCRTSSCCCRQETVITSSRSNRTV